MSTVDRQSGPAGSPSSEPERIGRADSDWPDWYVEYMVREQSGQALPV
jgi:hypothetical protein